MKIVIRPDAASVAELSARLIAQMVTKKPKCVLGLATGRTMEAVYTDLVTRYRTTGLDFGKCSSFNLDEYIGLAPADSRSYHSYMRTQLFGQVNLDSARTHVPNGQDPDHVAQGALYEAAIVAAGGIDLQLLGLGETGHIGFNEPLSAFRSRTRAVTLAPETRRQNSAMFGGNEDDVPRRAMTMGIATILDARRILLVVTGAAKASVLARAIEEPMSAMVSGSALQLHANCVVLADEAAASRFTKRDYYNWVIANEPELPDA